MDREAADQIITSRLLVVQSKRLLLSSVERRHGIYGSDSLAERVVRLVRETDAAQHAYRTTILSLGSPDDNEYWVVAYGRLIAVGRALALKLRDSTPRLTASDRDEVSTEVEALEQILRRWSDSLRDSMAPAPVLSGA